MTIFVETAYAKLNLALHVRARRPDGYHELETLFAFLDDGDRLSATPAEDFSLTITGPFATGLSAGEDNLVLRAVRALAAAWPGHQPLAFTLHKRLPIAAGIGGGSADAAAALRLAARLWGLPEVAPSRVAAAIGADVPACLASHMCFGRGLGEVLSPIAREGIAGLPVLLVNPLVVCPTGPVFKAWDGVDRGPLDPAQWRAGRNDLERPARALVPEIATVLGVLRATDADLVRMSGSGATCFALFAADVARDAAAARIAAAHPAWWIMAGALR